MEKNLAEIHFLNQYQNLFGHRKCRIFSINRINEWIEAIIRRVPFLVLKLNNLTKVKWPYISAVLLINIKSRNGQRFKDWDQQCWMQVFFAQSLFTADHSFHQCLNRMQWHHMDVEIHLCPCLGSCIQITMTRWQNLHGLNQNLFAEVFTLRTMSSSIG